MKKFLAIFTVVASFAFSNPAFAHNQRYDQGGFNLQITPWGSSLNIGGRNGVTINEGYGNNWNGGYRGWNNQGWNNRGWDNRNWNNRNWNNRGWDNRNWNNRNWNNRNWNNRNWNNRNWNNRPIVTQHPYYYFDAYGREVYVDQYGQATYTGNVRSGGDCDCN